MLRAMLQRFLALLLPALLAALQAPAHATGEQALALATPTGTLHGTLALPAVATATSTTTAPLPVALIIAGSGPTDRDGNSALLPGRNDSLKRLATALAEAGIASLRYDKRGIAASAAAGPSEAELRFDHYVDDAAAWVQRLAQDPRFAPVLVIGHSEGALIGLLAAQRSAVAGYVSIAGPADAAPVVLRRQLAGRLPPELAARNEAILSALQVGQPQAHVPEPLMALYRPSVQPYLISWFRHTPSAELARLTLPCLIMQGDTDIQVGVADARALHAARPACTLAVLPGMNHVLKAVPADMQQQLASYGDATLPLVPALPQAIVQFVRGLPTR